MSLNLKAGSLLEKFPVECFASLRSPRGSMYSTSRPGLPHLKSNYPIDLSSLGKIHLSVEKDRPIQDSFLSGLRWLNR